MRLDCPELSRVQARCNSQCHTLLWQAPILYTQDLDSRMTGEAHLDKHLVPCFPIQRSCKAAGSQARAFSVVAKRLHISCISVIVDQKAPLELN